MKKIKQILNWPINKLHRLFLWSSGADLDILDQAPTDENKYYGIGGTIIFTALMATFAGGYAFFTAFKIPILSVFFGLFWGALIFNLDRYIVSSFGVGDGKKTISKQELIEAAPRLLMAILLGFVIATPLELKLFEREIRAEIKKENLITIQDQKTDAIKKAELENQFYLDEISTLRNRTDERIAELRSKKEKRDEAYDKYMCELNGTCGTGVPGDGPVFKEAKENYLTLNQEYKRLEDDYIEKNNADNKTVIKYQQTIDDNLTDAKERVAELETEIESRDGLLAQIKALSQLTSEDRSLMYAKWLITLLFIFIEIAPILFKMMTERGPYDDILDRIKHEAKVKQLLLKSNLNQEINIAVKLHNDKTNQKLSAELSANKELLNSIAKAQAQVAQVAIEKWKEQQIEKVSKQPSLMIKSN
tara:strand:+ start:8163 stop:9419 length:1257 start_codon:yes stop_codon:yes gene_type:complete